MATQPRVMYDGREYAVRSRSTEIPDLDNMPRMSALVWLIQHTYPKGTNHRRPTPDIRGLALREGC